MVDGFQIFSQVVLVVSVDLGVRQEEVMLDEDNPHPQAFERITEMMMRVSRIVHLNIDGMTYLGCNTNRQQNAGGGAGNFFTGAALGALGGYVFGNRNRR